MSRVWGRTSTGVHATRTRSCVGAAATLVTLVLMVGCGARSVPAATSTAEGAAATPAATATTPVATAASNAVTLALITLGLSAPVGIVNAGDGSDRLFAVERGGQVRVIDADGTLRAASFVDLSDRVEDDGWERGLLGLAFHPDFRRNGRLFIHYSRIGDGATVISELTASVDLSSADPTSERILLTLAQPSPFHNGGQMAFGPDGYLYVGLGDGGPDGDPQQNGQNLQTLLGKILRIDVDGARQAAEQYAIPSDNPFAAGGIAPSAGLPEIWAYGLRNPWRFSFDRSNGDLYIGDVGEASWEEIDRQAAGSPGGENYGWNAHEGTHCYSPACSQVAAIAPIAEYGHDRGCSVVGGYVYRGSRQPALVGIYLFADYCAGSIFSLPAGGAAAPMTVATTGMSISSFGQGEDGELYLVDVAGGGLYRVAAGG
jgi:glucose/arabinose dehydrogenase